MKINRLIEITVLLLNRESITAKELAERFQVSTRTIYRDIEVLSASGIPVYMSKGNGGGISLLDEYSINKTILSNKDKESLVIALNTLHATRYPEVNLVLEKMGAIFNNEFMEDWIHVDFSRWGSNPNEEDRFLKIRMAILKRKVINFQYINSLADKSIRSVEPMKLIFKGQAWYLYGYCRLKQEFRTFRISRIKRLSVTEENFERREIKNTYNYKYKEIIKNVTKFKLRFKGQALYRIFDDFDENMIFDNHDGTYDVNVSFQEDEWVYGYILSFGNYVEVIEPVHVRDIIINKMKEAINQYEKYSI